MASIKKKYNKWQVRISWVDNLGKRHFKSKNGFPTKKMAQVWAANHEAKLSNGVDISKEISLSSYFSQWVATYKEPQVSDVSMVRYRTTERYLLNFFGQRNIKTITRTDYQEFINWYGSNHAPSSVQKTNGFIRACVKSAILDDYLMKDFTEGVTLVSNQDKVVKVQYLNLDEIGRLIKSVNGGLNYHFTSRYMILTAIYTGMRLSEIQALTWQDVDLKNGTIDINKSWNAVKHEFKRTKNESSNRRIKINHILIHLMSDLKQHSSSTLVFLDQYGTIPTSGAINRTLRKIMLEAGIQKRNFHFHSLRHSHVALLLANGIDIYSISKRLGHSNIKTTANTYAYLVDEYKDKTNEKIVAILDQF